MRPVCLIAPPASTTPMSTIVTDPICLLKVDQTTEGGSAVGATFDGRMLMPESQDGSYVYRLVSITLCSNVATGILSGM